MGRRDPKLRVAGFTLSAAADELWLHGTFFSFFRSILVVLNVIYLLIAMGVIANDGCVEKDEQYYLLVVYAIATLICTAGSTLMYYLIRTISKRGDMFDQDARSHITIPIYTLLIFYLLEVITNGFGMYLAITWKSTEECAQTTQDSQAWLIFWIIWIWLDILWFLLFAHISVLRKRDEKMLRNLNEFERLSWEWNQRFRTWCCWSKFMTCGLIGGIDGEDKDHAYAQVGDVFGRWFVGHNMNLSDFVASLLLLRMEQKRIKESQLVRAFDHQNEAFALDVTEQRLSDDFDDFLWGDLDEDESSSKAPPPSVYAANDATTIKAKSMKKKTGVMIPKFEVKKTASMEMTPENVAELKFVRNYLPHMLAIYGWKLLVYMDTIELRPLRSLTKLLRIPSVKDEKRFLSEDDNYCHCAGSTLLRQTNLKPENIVYASFTAIEGKHIPYAVMVDHDLQSVVITCRGSLSLQDLITDMIIEPISLISSGREWGFDGDGHYAHEGFFQVAQTIRRRLQRNQVLHALLGVTPGITVDASIPDNEDFDSKLKTKLEDLPECKGYDLVVLGHSLGGGVAAILALMLRSEFPDLKCISYSSPGCVFDVKLAEKVKDFVVSPFVGKDAVSHLSWGSLQKVRGQALDMLRRSKTNKGEIFQTLYSKRKVDDMIYQHYQVPKTPEREEIAEQILDLAKETRGKVDRIKMHNPGRVMHFAKVSTTKIGLFKKKRKYAPFWVDNNDMDQLEISSRMLLDHFPNYLAFIIEEVAKEYVPEE